MEKDIKKITVCVETVLGEKRKSVKKIPVMMRSPYIQRKDKRETE